MFSGQAEQAVSLFFREWILVFMEELIRSSFLFVVSRSESSERSSCDADLPSILVLSSLTVSSISLKASEMVSFISLFDSISFEAIFLMIMPATASAVSGIAV